MSGTGLLHPGRQHSWQTAGALAAASELSWYATAIYNDPRRWPYSALSRIPGRIGVRVRAMLERRTSQLFDRSHVRHVPAAEWAELSLARLGWRSGANAVNRIGNHVFQRCVLGLLRTEPVARLWAYDTSCDWIFAQPEARNCIRVLDQSAGYARAVRTILEAEQARYPQYFPAEHGIPTEAAVRQADREIHLADHIVVGAQHSVDAMIEQGVDARRVHLVPYGYEESRFPCQPPERPSIGELPVNFLFVGSVGPRKGVHLLIEAFRRISPRYARLRLVGPLAMPARLLRDLGEGTEYMPSLPHERIAEEYARAHCFVFPTMIDGGGVVLYEAAASGLGIVQSAMCGDGVRSGADGVNGVVLRETTVDELRDAIDRILTDPTVLRDWSAASWAVRQERTWSAYRRRIIELLPHLT